ncbi:hypothetical protein IW261DRAFT_1422941 [Armillaria novae-zelandiae]|uniref:Uncharacterized protein n=1 Tax=Armillaria novae-zelandiae TaxID=153914 RepID=A0AA39NYR4_9AGAR|nr:hypothetical protein IW261DRAFT_1422941 [Armillaria novae-zelandiae]
MSHTSDFFFNNKRIHIHNAYPPMYALGQGTLEQWLGINVALLQCRVVGKLESLAEWTRCLSIDPVVNVSMTKTGWPSSMGGCAVREKGEILLRGLCASGLENGIKGHITCFNTFAATKLLFLEAEVARDVEWSIGMRLKASKHEALPSSNCLHLAGSLAGNEEAVILWCRDLTAGHQWQWSAQATWWVYQQKDRLQVCDMHWLLLLLWHAWREGENRGTAHGWDYVQRDVCMAGSDNDMLCRRSTSGSSVKEWSMQKEWESACGGDGGMLVRAWRVSEGSERCLMGCEGGRQSSASPPSSLVWMALGEEGDKLGAHRRKGDCMQANGGKGQSANETQGRRWLAESTDACGVHRGKTACRQDVNGGGSHMGGG